MRLPKGFAICLPDSLNMCNSTLYYVVLYFSAHAYTYAYGGRPSETHTLEDQLGLVPGTKLKIEDGSTVGTSVTLRTAVADFR